MFNDFVYDRPSYFTTASLRFALEHAGFAKVAVTPTFGRQHAWVTAEYGRERRRPAARLAPGGVVMAIERYLLSEPGFRAAVRLKLEDLNATGRVAIWGAGAKGATFLNLVDPRCELVDCAVDTNPNKQNMFVAGTGHPIVSRADVSARGVRHVMVMNANHVNEARRAIHATHPEVAVAEWPAVGQPLREKGPEEKHPRTAPAEPSAPGDPIHVVRSALAERARWDQLFREARITLKEVDRIRHTIARARGLEASGSSRGDRALDRLLEGRGDWFEVLLNEPAKVPSALRAALAQVAADVA
jgi:hypothetical protein